MHISILVLHLSLISVGFQAPTEEVDAVEQLLRHTPLVEFHEDKWGNTIRDVGSLDMLERDLYEISRYSTGVIVRAANRYIAPHDENRGARFMKLYALNRLLFIVPVKRMPVYSQPVLPPLEGGVLFPWKVDSQGVMHLTGRPSYFLECPDTFAELLAWAKSYPRRTLTQARLADVKR